MCEIMDILLNVDIVLDVCAEHLKESGDLVEKKAVSKQVDNYF